MATLRLADEPLPEQEVPWPARTHLAALPPPPDERRGKRHQLIVLIAAAAVVAVLGFIAARAFIFRSEDTLTPVGAQSVPLTAEWLGFWTEYRRWLGDPESTGSFEGQPDCVTWRSYTTCRTTTSGPANLLAGYQVVNLGERTALALGVPVKLGIKPAAVVQAYLDQLDRDGVNWRFWIGQVLTDPLCIVDSTGQNGSCVVYTTNQVLRYPLGSTNTAEVQPDLGYQTKRP